MSRVDDLIANYERFVQLPWPSNLAPAQRVWMAVYTPEEERRLRLHLPEFATASKKAGYEWELIDISEEFECWMASHEYRDAYFANPMLMQPDLVGFFEQLAGDLAVGWSGGSEPASQINPAAIEAMAERGIDISREFPKPWTDEVVRAADVIVTMGCGDACPIFPGKRYEDWTVADPADLDLADVRVIRDDIERRVRTLIGEIVAVAS